MNDHIIEQIIATHVSTARRGNPSMSGPLKKDHETAQNIIAHLNRYGYSIAKDQKHG